MTTDTLASVKAEHERMHARLADAAGETGALGEAARELARLLRAHFSKEEQYAIPPLCLLPKLAWGTASADMASIVPLTRRLKAELPAMLIEHKEIITAARLFRTRAHEAGRIDYEDFADELSAHAQHEEEVLYPAAVVLGEYLALKLKETEVA